MNIIFGILKFVAKNNQITTITSLLPSVTDISKKKFHLFQGILKQYLFGVYCLKLKFQF